MTGKTHILGGIAMGLVISRVCLPEISISYYVGCGIGALLADIDHPHSMINKLCFPIGYPLSRCCKHRTYTHTIWFALFITFLNFCLISSLYYILGCFIGMLSHLVLDSLNPTGVAWFYPVSKLKHHVLSIRTGGAGENSFSLIVVLIIYFLLFEYPL